VVAVVMAALAGASGWAEAAAAHRRSSRRNHKPASHEALPTAACCGSRWGLRV
jgi:hypothetical protein